jgi:accessory gene regulator B
MHASKSISCLISSIIVFLGVPFLALILRIDSFFTLLLGILCLIIIFVYAPADTYKRPLINSTKRKKYKIKATIVAGIYTVIAILVGDSLISNLLVFSLVTEVILILPITYRIFNKPYRNYESYQKFFSA